LICLLEAARGKGAIRAIVEFADFPIIRTRYNHPIF